ncbi:MAG: rhomboid family intramembrane serine protease [Bacteroidota bacterium]|nr:rhomboid family intramembrane serine protease [Bacteroidota bacterium]
MTSNFDMSLPLLLLIISNVFVSNKGFSDLQFFDRYKFSVYQLQKNEYFRLLTSGFLHVNTLHLIFNMFALYIFGDVVIQFTGVYLFLLIYIASLLAGNYFTYFNHKNEPNYTAVGASGAVSGIVYSSILIFPQMKLALLFLPIPIPGYIFGILYLLYTLFGMKSRRDNIGHTSHFGGALAGFVITLFIYPSVINTQMNLILLMLAPLLLYLVMKRIGYL